MQSLSTVCGRNHCQKPALYVLRSPRLPLCARHAAQICDTDVIEEMYHPLIAEILEVTSWKKPA